VFAKWDTFAYLIKLSANRLRENSQNIAGVLREHLGALALRRKTRINMTLKWAR